MPSTLAAPYKFKWTDLGDIELGRPNLGLEVPVAVYRLAQYTMRDVLARRFDDEFAAQMLREAGWVSGQEFCLNVLDRSLPLQAFVDALEQALRTLKIGILRVEKMEASSLEFTMTVSEDLDCSGLPIKGTTVCEYDEGFIAGIFHAYTGREFSAVEIDCWATGDRTCRFVVGPHPV